MIAYAIAGRVDINFETEPLATLDDGSEVLISLIEKHASNKCIIQVFLRDIWPSRADIQEVESKYVIPKMFEVGFLLSEMFLVIMLRLVLSSTFNFLAL